MTKYCFCSYNFKKRELNNKIVKRRIIFYEVRLFFSHTFKEKKINRKKKNSKTT